MRVFQGLLCSPAYFFHSIETYHVARLMLNFARPRSASPALNWSRERVSEVGDDALPWLGLSSRPSGFLPRHLELFKKLGIKDGERREGKEKEAEEQGEDVAWHLQLFTQSLASEKEVVGCRFLFQAPKEGSRRGAVVGEGFHDDYGILLFLGFWALAPHSSQSGGMKATIFGLQARALNEIASSSLAEDKPLFHRLTPGAEKTASQFLRRLAHLEMALVWSAGPCGLGSAAAFGKSLGTVQAGSLFGVWTPWVSQSYTSPLPELHSTGGVMRAVPVKLKTG